MNVAGNFIVIIALQSSAIVYVTHVILVPQFFLFGIVKYTSTFVHDMQLIIRKSDTDPKQRIFDVIRLHESILRLIFIS